MGKFGCMRFQMINWPLARTGNRTSRLPFQRLPLTFVATSLSNHYGLG